MSSQRGKRIKKSTTSQQTESVNISKFPDKIILRIFNQLSFTDKLNCTLVCKKWNQLISSSPKFINSTFFKPSIKSPSQLKSKLLNFSPTRNYRIVAIDLNGTNESTKYDQQVVKFLTHLVNIAMHIKVLHLYHIPGRFDVQVCQLLVQCNSLFVLDLDDVDCNIDAADDEYPEIIKLPKLRQIHVAGLYDWLFKFIDCKELVYLSISRIPGPNITNFINNLKRLKSLHLDDLSVSPKISFDPKFELEILTIFCPIVCDDYKNDRDNFKCMENLIMAAAPSSQIELNNCSEYPHRIEFMMKTIDLLGEFGDLNNLDLEVNLVAIDAEFIARLKMELCGTEPLKNLRRFTLKDLCPQNDVLPAGCLDWLFRLLPNLEFLGISSNLIHAFNPSTTADLFKHLSHINITRQVSESELEKFQHLYFPSINGVIISVESIATELHDRSYLENFVHLNLTLEKFFVIDQDGYMLEVIQCGDEED